MDNEDQGVFLDGEYNLYQAHALHDFDPFLGFKIVSDLPLAEGGGNALQTIRTPLS